MAVTDVEVCKAMISENCARSILCLLESSISELIHRTLVMIIELLSVSTEVSNDQTLSNEASNELKMRKEAAQHLVAGGVVPVIGVVVKLNDPNMTHLAKEDAAALSRAMKFT